MPATDGGTRSTSVEELGRIMLGALHGRNTTAGDLVTATRPTGLSLVSRRHALLGLLEGRKALVRVPLSMIEDDTPVYDVRLTPGGTTWTILQKTLGPSTEPDIETVPSEATWVLHRSEGSMEPRTMQYYLREKCNPMRPPEFELPFTALQSGEALILRAGFRRGTLIESALSVI